MRRPLAVVLALVLATAVSARAQQPTLVVENGRVITGDGTVLEEAAVVVAGDSIQSVTEEPVEAPEARRIDASGKTVLPGLIDAHVHLLVPDVSSVPNSASELESWMKAHLPGRLRAFLNAGITTVMSTGDFWPRIREVRNSVHAGEPPGPRILTSGPVLTAPGGHPAVTICGRLDRTEKNNAWCRKHLAVEPSTREEARADVDRLAENDVDLIKMVYDSIGPPNVQHMSRPVMNEGIAAAHDHGLSAYAHIQEVGDALVAIEAGLDGLVHIPFRATTRRERRELAVRMQDEGVTAASTLVATETLRDRAADRGNDEVTKLFDARLRARLRTTREMASVDDGMVVLGTDTPWLAPAESFHEEVQLLRKAGLTPQQVIQAATRNAALHMGRGADLGTLEAGKVADLIVVDGNPLDELSALEEVEVVVQDGEIVSGREER